MLLECALLLFLADCGDALANDGAPVVESSTCNMVCPQLVSNSMVLDADTLDKVCNGNTTEYCGGQSRLNIVWNMLPI